MKKKTLVVCLCMLLFAGLSLGSSSSDSGSKTELTESSSEETDSKEEGEEKNTADVSIEEQVLVDQDGVKITALEYETDSILGDKVKLQVENNTSQNLMFTAKALIVNDYMISDLFAEEVAAGKKANESLDLYNSELEAAGIDTVGKIEVAFHIYDSESLDDLLDTDLITIQTSEFSNMDTTPDDVGQELYNENGIRIVGKAVDEGSFWGTAILLYIENNSGKNVGISVDNMSINDFMVSPFFSTTVYNGKMDIDHITVFDSDLEENGIEKIEKAELSFHIYDADSYDTIADSSPITINAN